MNEGANDAHASLDCNVAIKNAGKHDCAMLGKNPRQLASAAMRT